jgi:hypothetical protein
LEKVGKKERKLDLPKMTKGVGLDYVTENISKEDVTHDMILETVDVCRLSLTYSGYHPVKLELTKALVEGPVQG